MENTHDLLVGTLSIGIPSIAYYVNINSIGSSRLDISGFIIQSQLLFLHANLRGMLLYFHCERGSLSSFSVWRVNFHNISL